MADDSSNEIVRTKERKTRPDGSFYDSNASIRMAQLREDGRVGPQFGKLGGRPRKPRASEIIAEEARKQAQNMIKALNDALEDDSTRIRMDAVRMYTDIEQREASTQIDEAKLDQMPRDQLETELNALLSDPSVANALGLPQPEPTDVITIDASDAGEDPFFSNYGE